ncbi:hypothetical protein H101_03211 [Trichophyton interdigitale H6]|nr:hypothetical protein H101_03211 [Trichophyton interdigitale H6]
MEKARASDSKTAGRTRGRKEQRRRRRRRTGRGCGGDSVGRAGAGRGQSEQGPRFRARMCRRGLPGCARSFLLLKPHCNCETGGGPQRIPAVKADRDAGRLRKAEYIGTALGSTSKIYWESEARPKGGCQ